MKFYTRTSDVSATVKPEQLKASIEHYLRYHLGKNPESAAKKDVFRATALVLREFMLKNMLETQDRQRAAEAKRVYYLSMEFLIGRSLGNNLYNLGLFDQFAAALNQLGADIDEIRDCERDAALGNGGLGRLAACFLDSMASLNIPGFGYGINYEYGLFRQRISRGYQKELPDHWLEEGTPWQIERHDNACLIPIYGHVQEVDDGKGKSLPMWLDWKLLIGIPYDMPVVGYSGKTVNYLRLYSARSSDKFDMNIFNSGDYINAVEQKILSETVSKVLYPSDSIQSGKELRLTQEYFMVACALRDIMRQFKAESDDIFSLPKKVAIQLNDTHPALAVAELMRILIDEEHLSFADAWSVTTETLAYTNHTLLPEALEKWPVPLVQKLLPRHLQIIYEINHHFLAKVAKQWPGDAQKLSSLSIIEESEPRQVRMAYLSIVGSHSVNGVAELHSELVKTELVPDFYKMWPEKFNNKTNGVTQRRWLLKSNPLLADLISEKIGDSWITDLSELRGLEAFATDEMFQQRFMKIKHENKARLSGIVNQLLGNKMDPNSIFDIQIKRIHEYKRQLLNVMHVIHLYLSIVDDGRELRAPRTCIFAGKAAPGYWEAKQIIKLINSVAKVVNKDTRVKDQLRVVFIPDYRVSIAEKIFPAADLSEQISTAGMEASGTGNMKFSLNGALTIGTLDGANVEIREEVGEDNIFIFGHKADEILKLKSADAYNPKSYYRKNDSIRRVMDAINSNMFCVDDPGLFGWIFENVVNRGDYYFHLADMEDYIRTQEAVADLYCQPYAWTEKAILNVARMGKFSSDRTIRQYADEIWNVKAV